MRTVVTAVSLLSGWVLASFSSSSVETSSAQYLIMCGYGGLCFATGVLLRLWATSAIGSRKQHCVVRHGPYAICRNPLYLGTLFIALSMAFFLQSLTFAVVLIIPVIVYVVGVVPAEERLLSAKFGAEYATYFQTTSRWWPQFRGNWSNARYETSRRIWNSEFRRCQYWLLLIVAALIGSQLRSSDWWPQLFDLP